MLSKAGANVVSCDKSTNIEELENAISSADIVVSATGVIDPFDARILRQDCTLIDVGFNWDLRTEQFRGDVDFTLAVEKCRLLSLIPGGVGPVNASLLIRNLVSNWSLTYFTQNEIEKASLQ